MKIVIIGHPCIDILHKDNLEIQSYGGILYSLIGFTIVADDKDEFYPIFQISKEHIEPYLEQIKSFSNIRKDFIEISLHPTNIVHLFFNGEQLNFECYQSRAPRIEIKKLLNKIPEDSNFYINMISGFELELDDLKFIRKNFGGKIYLDFHTLTRGINEEGKRVYRPLDDWKDWISCCNAIQLNEIEMANLTPEKLEEEPFAKECIEAGVEVVNITKGSEGAVSYFLEDSKIKSLHVLPEKNLKFKSNVGCGDIFGAVFSYNYFRNEKIEICLKEAVKISSKRIEIERIEDIIEKLKNKN